MCASLCLSVSNSLLHTEHWGQVCRCIAIFHLFIFLFINSDSICYGIISFAFILRVLSHLLWSNTFAVCDTKFIANRKVASFFSTDDEREEKSGFSFFAFSFSCVNVCVFVAGTAVGSLLSRFEIYDLNKLFYFFLAFVRLSFIYIFSHTDTVQCVLQYIRWMIFLLSCVVFFSCDTQYKREIIIDLRCEICLQSAVSVCRNCKCVLSTPALVWECMWCVCIFWTVNIFTIIKTPLCGSPVVFIWLNCVVKDNTSTDLPSTILFVHWKVSSSKFFLFPIRNPCGIVFFLVCIFCVSWLIRHNLHSLTKLIEKNVNSYANTTNVFK